MEDLRSDPVDFELRLSLADLSESRPNAERLSVGFAPSALLSTAPASPAHTTDQ